jgi:hypothetical protein
MVLYFVGVTDYLTTEISTSKQKRFSLVTFVDTPGLVDGDMKYPFDVNKSILWLGKKIFIVHNLIKIGHLFEDTKGVIRIHKSKKNSTQWPKEKVQKGKQRSAKHTYKTKDRVTRTPLKTGVELRCSGRVGSCCSTSGTRRVNLVTNLVISHE